MEPHLDERADAGSEIRGELVRERAVEREERAVDADGDGTGERRTRREDGVPSGADGATEVVDAVRRLPGELFAAEVAVRRGLAVDRARQVELADDRGRPEVEDVPQRRRAASGRRCSVPNVSTMSDTGCAVPIA